MANFVSMLIALLRANVDNDTVSDADFRKLVRNSLAVLPQQEKEKA